MLQPVNSYTISRSSVVFILICIVAFVACTIVTIYFNNTMGDEMMMPGNWSMSMMWMRMPGETWFSSAISFLLMWLAMMIVMMIPSAVPTFLKTKMQWRNLCYMTSGYFIVWLIAGLFAYIIGVAINNAAMHSEFLSNMMPLFASIALLIAGCLQFTSWKITRLLRCRSSFGCSVSYAQDENSFTLGCKQGVACCACCSGLMLVQLVLGIMNPLVMIIVSVIIAAEKLLPKPILVARFAGIIIISAGLSTICYWLQS